MKLTLVFLIFGTVIAAGCALRCDTCNVTSVGVDNCPGVAQECENQDDFCATQIEYNILGGDNKQTVRKRCMPKDQELICNRPMLLNTTEQFQFLLYSTCCNSDCCNSGGIQMPLVNLTENGHSCQSCFVEGSLQCSTFETVNCTCQQFQCFNFSGNATRPGDIEKPYAFQGCITNGTCMVDLHNLPGSKVSKDAVYTCV